MIDLDHFKRINDTYGHSTGDEVLRKFADIVRQNCRYTDTPARLGGEEFAILLRGTTQQDALLVAERLRREIANTVFEHPKGMIQVTVSIGGAALLENDLGGDIALTHADTALYQSKEKGRNQVNWFNTQYNMKP